MKKFLIASIVGGLIIFFWQFLSFTVLDLHRPAQQYTANQDTIISFLRSNLKEGRYFIPTVPQGTSSKEQQEFNEKMNGRDWAIIDYHSSYDNGKMGMNMLRGFLVNVFMIYLLCWILTRVGMQNFSTIFLSTFFIGLIAFLNFPYTYYIWYQSPGIWSDLIDAVVPWGLTGAWLGWYLNRK